MDEFVGSDGDWGVEGVSDDCYGTAGLGSGSYQIITVRAEAFIRSQDFKTSI